MKSQELAQNMRRKKNVWDKVLFVGLKLSLSKTIRTLLEKNGFPVFEENNLSQAFKIISEQDISSIVFDQDTYEPCGEEFIQKCSKIMGHPTLIVLTENTRPGNFQKLFQYKVHDCFLKPFKTSLLLDSIKRGFEYRRSHLYGVKDSLTGMYNRYVFKEILRQEIDRAHRYERHLSLLMIDIDYFKKINDLFGHTVGDHVLQEVSSIIKETVRKTDMITRFGGEEFAIILPETTVGHATLLAERIRKKIEKNDYSAFIKKEPLTVSIGISNYHTPGQKSDLSLVHSADQALYAAKREGRNKVVISVPSR